MEWSGRTLQADARNYIDGIASCETFKDLAKKAGALIVYGDADTAVPPPINPALKDVLQADAVEGAFVRFFIQKL
jgi:hypothetical protein